MKELKEHVTADMERAARLTGGEEVQATEVKIRKRTKNVTPCRQPPVTISKEERKALHKAKMMAKGRGTERIARNRQNPGPKIHPTPNLSRRHKNRGLHPKVAYDTPVT